MGLTGDAIAPRLDALYRGAPHDWVLAAARIAAAAPSGLPLARVPVPPSVGTGIRRWWAGANLTAALAMAERRLVSHRPPGAGRYAAASPGAQ